MKLLQNLAVKLSVTKAELTVITILIFFLLLGGIASHLGSVRRADELIRTMETERYREAEVDSLLKLAPGLDATLEEDMKQGLVSLDEKNPRTSEAHPERTAKKNFAGTIAFNSSTEKQLQQIQGIGPVMAKRLLKFRTSKGGKVLQFDDFLEVEGIGKKKLELLKKHLTL
jgi:competence protein ComEA